MFDESLYKVDHFVYSRQEDPISLHFLYLEEGKNVPSIDRNISSEELKERNGQPYIHIDLDGGCFEFVIIAVTDDGVYASLLQRSAESAWHLVKQEFLTKLSPRGGSPLRYQNKTPYGTYLIYVNEWGELKPGLGLHFKK